MSNNEETIANSEGTITNDTSLTSGTNEVPLVSERPTYMIAPRRGPSARLQGVQPMSVAKMNENLVAMGIDIVGHVKRGKGTVQTLSAGAGEATDIVLAKIEPERADFLRKSIPANLLISEDKSLDYGGVVGSRSLMPPIRTFSLTAETKTKKYRFQFLGKGDKPLSKITVQLVGDAFPTPGITNENGEVELEIITMGDNPPRFLMATAPDSYWDIQLANPQVNENTVNIIRMRSFSDTIPGFPEQFQFGWGQRLMGLDKLPKEINGVGVKIAIIDSGCDNSHPLLSHIQHGKDFTGDSNQNSWTQDTIGHGTHCAGIIAARSINGSMMRGFAPDAEIHILRVFPGGQYSSLIQAIDYCIDHQIDVVNMSLGGDSAIDPVVEEALETAYLHGIACIVAAGNSGDAVKYPASSRLVLSVAAVGSIENLQSNTWETTTVQQGLVAPDGIFSPSFTCFGPEIAVCAPGVEIISTVPGGTFEAMSGTSMAAPHVTGFAALLFAHHPHLRMMARSTDRVAGLFQLIRTLCSPYAFGNSSTRSGNGLPKLDQIIAALQVLPTNTAGTVSQPINNSNVSNELVTNGGTPPAASTGAVHAASTEATPAASTGAVHAASIEATPAASTEAVHAASIGPMHAATGGMAPMSIGEVAPMSIGGVAPISFNGVNPYLNNSQLVPQNWINNSISGYAPMVAFMMPFHPNQQAFKVNGTYLL
ncbi:hypothetical protein CN285_13810 [Bacillus cereus]|nr:hypothetical protein CN285_13810 [Bacillus cereus]